MKSLQIQTVSSVKVRRCREALMGSNVSRRGGEKMSGENTADLTRLLQGESVSEINTGQPCRGLRSREHMRISGKIEEERRKDQY